MARVLAFLGLATSAAAWHEGNGFTKVPDGVLTGAAHHNVEWQCNNLCKAAGGGATGEKIKVHRTGTNSLVYCTCADGKIAGLACDETECFWDKTHIPTHIPSPAAPLPVTGSMVNDPTVANRLQKLRLEDLKHLAGIKLAEESSFSLGKVAAAAAVCTLAAAVAATVAAARSRG
eukprot:337641_1